jgi:hypothetical protein
VPEILDHFDEHHPNERLVFDDEYRCLPHPACLTCANLPAVLIEEIKMAPGADASSFLTVVNRA